MCYDHVLPLYCGRQLAGVQMCAAQENTSHLEKLTCIVLRDMTLQYTRMHRVPSPNTHTCNPIHSDTILRRTHTLLKQSVFS